MTPTQPQPRPRTFQSIGPREPAPPSPEVETLRLAVRKIARTREGKVLIGYMRTVSAQVCPPEASLGALSELNGVRRFIATIEKMIADEQRSNA